MTLKRQCPSTQTGDKQTTIRLRVRALKLRKCQIIFGNRVERERDVMSQVDVRSDDSARAEAE